MTRPHILPIPFIDPACAFAAFADSPVAALLDSAGPGDPRGRYAYIGTDPFRVIAWRRSDGGDPFRLLADALKEFRVAADPALPPFQTGAIGYFGYELAGSLECLPAPQETGPDLPDLFAGLYDTVVTFDLVERQAWIVAIETPDRPPPGERMAAMAARIAAAPPVEDPGTGSAWRDETSRSAYESRVGRVIDYVRAGDIYQANLSHRMLAGMPAGVTPQHLFHRLRQRNPAPFAALLQCGPGQAVVSASPERFLRLYPDGRIETRPIKGTRPRGATRAADAALADALLASAKDRAENLMIVDLLRNDLSRVARTGSVRVPQLCGLESFATVHHLVSSIEAELRDGLGPVDLLRASFPGGSITGAPKIRAMEVIRELEVARRGPYCGAVAWLGFDGTMDSSIVIRTLVVDGEAVILQAGGGIVADSDPADEYDETLDKARALRSCLDAWNEGEDGK